MSILVVFTLVLIGHGMELLTPITNPTANPLYTTQELVWLFFVISVLASLKYRNE